MVQISLDKVQFNENEGRWTAYAAALSKMLGVDVARFEGGQTYFDLKIGKALSVVDLAALMHTVITYNAGKYRLREIVPMQFGGNPYNLATFVTLVATVGEE